MSEFYFRGIYAGDVEILKHGRGVAVDFHHAVFGYSTAYGCGVDSLRLRIETCRLHLVFFLTDAEVDVKIGFFLCADIHSNMVGLAGVVVDIGLDRDEQFGILRRCHQRQCDSRH